MPPKVILIGISGPSSSGKTTLSRLLRSIYPSGTTFILHEDDFYLPDGQIPIHDGLADWDCAGALDLAGLAAALRYIKAHGASPPDLVSKEDQNSVGPVDVDEGAVRALRDAAQGLTPDETVVAIVDGFLLFAECMPEVRELFDVRLFLRTDYVTAKGRREARKGYVTLDGFWEDPPGYVDRIVWPNYVRDHAFLFEGGDVEGDVDGDVSGKLGISIMPKDAQGDMTACVKWAFGVIEERLRVS